MPGQATLSNDRNKIKELWSTADKVFWRDENDPAIRVLRVAPNAAEFSESGGGEPHLHDNEKVTLARPVRS